MKKRNLKLRKLTKLNYNSPYLQVFALGIILIIIAILHNYTLQNREKVDENSLKIEDSINETFYVENQVSEPLSDKDFVQEKPIENSIQNESEVIVDSFIYYPNIPLKEETQRYIWDKAEEHGLSYELILAVIKIESNFDRKAVSYNGSSVGLMQINRNNTINWLAQETGINNLNPYNEKHSIKMGTWYLAYLKEYWLDKGLSEEHASKAMLISYHRGIGGSKSYIRNNGFNSKYTNKVFTYKNELESEG